MIHHTHPTLLDRFTVDLVGAGGNGSQMLTCLARLRHALGALGHPGFTVTTWDDDTVSAANVGRQMFSPADVGLAKADVLTHRVNAFFGLDWDTRVARYVPENPDNVADLTVVCVDSRESRRGVAAKIRSATARNGLVYVLDLGNRAADGQAILGQIGRARNARPRPMRRAGENTPAAPRAEHIDLPDPYALLPDLTKPGREDTAPSCSLAEALERQELFVNDDVVRAGALILWHLLRHGQLRWHGVFCNSDTGQRRPLAVDPAQWAAMKGGT